MPHPHVLYPFYRLTTFEESVKSNITTKKIILENIIKEDTEDVLSVSGAQLVFFSPTHA